MTGSRPTPDRLGLAHVTITPRRGGTALVRDFSLAVDPGDIVTVMGPSGSGKSTLLAFVGGFLDAGVFEASGEVSIGGRSLAGQPPERRHLGILFQDPVLFPHLSVGENLLFGLPRKRLAGRQARQAAASDALAEAGLPGFFERDPATLSGGQRARVALLRTLLSEPRALLLDEPFGKLDLALRAEFRQFIFRHVRDRSLPTLLVTHDPADAEAAGGPVIDLAAGNSHPCFNGA